MIEIMTGDPLTTTVGMLAFEVGPYGMPLTSSGKQVEAHHPDLALLCREEAEAAAYDGDPNDHIGRIVLLELDEPFGAGVAVLVGMIVSGERDRRMCEVRSCIRHLHRLIETNDLLKERGVAIFLPQDPLYPAIVANMIALRCAGDFNRVAYRVEVWR